MAVAWRAFDASRVVECGRPAVQSRPSGWERSCDGLVLLGVGGTIVFAALAFGAVHLWAYTALEALMLSVAVVWCVRTLVTSVHSERRNAPSRDAVLDASCPAVSAFRSPSSLTAIVLGSWVLFTIVPLPPSLMRLLSPATYRLLADMLPGWPHTPGYADIAGVSAAGLLPVTWRPLALSPFLARAELLRSLAYVVAFLVVAYYPWRSDAVVARRLAQLLIGVALFEAGYFVMQDTTGSPNIYWFRKSPSVWLPSGTYINRNHFAGLLEMVVPISGALALGCWAALCRDIERARLGTTRADRRRLIDELVGSRAAFRLALFASLTLWLLAVLYRSLSRGGFLSPLAASCLLTPLLFRSRRDGVSGSLVRWLSPAIVVVGVALTVVTVSLPDLARRLEATEVTTAAAGRWAATRGAFAMAADFPLFGVGPGNFEFTFPAYRDFAGLRFTHVHDDYVELAVEAGLPSLVFVAVLLIGLYRRAAATFRRSADTPYLLWGALVGVTALLLHSFADFNLHIPANALVFAVVAGLAVRLSRPPRVQATLNRAARGLTAAVALSALGAIIALNLRPLGAEAAFRRAYTDSSLTSLLAERPRVSRSRADYLRRVAAANAENPFAQYLTGLQLQRDALRLLDAHRPAAALLARAAHHYVSAARVLPQWPAPHLQLGVLGLAGVSGLSPAEGAAALARAQRLDPHHRGIAWAIATIWSGVRERDIVQVVP
jgi:O-antigen ligase